MKRNQQERPAECRPAARVVERPRRPGQRSSRSRVPGTAAESSHLAPGPTRNRPRKRTRDHPRVDRFLDFWPKTKATRRIRSRLSSNPRHWQPSSCVALNFNAFVCRTRKTPPPPAAAAAAAITIYGNSVNERYNSSVSRTLFARFFLAQTTGRKQRETPRERSMNKKKYPTDRAEIIEATSAPVLAFRLIHREPNQECGLVALF